MNKIGKKIRIRRQEKGYSQEYIAEQLRISQPSYARLEKDDDKISLTKFIVIAKILDLRITDCFESLPPTNHVINNDKLIQQLKEEIKFLRKMIKKK